MKLHLPNVLTCCNLLSGCMAAVMIFRNHLEWAAYLVFISAFFDLLDGMAARKGQAYSPLGKELDSLADMVSFGFVPGAMVFKLLQLAGMDMNFQNEQVIQIIQFFPFFITVFSALRLAKFNIDTRQTASFIGLPTPANGLFIVSLPLILRQFPGKFDELILNPYTLIGFTILSSYLLVSNLPLFSMKFRTLDVRENLFQYILVLCALILFPVLLFAAIPVLIILYLLLSIIQNYTKIKPTQ